MSPDLLGVLLPNVTPRAVAARVMLAVIVGALFVPYSASAAPTLPEADERTASSAVAATATLGRDRASLETAARSIAAGAPFRYSARISLREPADDVRVRFRISHPSGRLIFQRTRSYADVDAGATKVEFERGTNDLGLRPGVFPVQLEVAIRRGGKTVESILTTGLFVYDGSAEPMAISLVARVSGQPLADPTDRFVSDPGRYARARVATHELASWVLSRPDARVTLAIPPVLLEEWRRIANGFELAGPEGVEVFGVDSTVAQEYGATLRILREAAATGRLELASLGYADPDLSDLNDADLLADVVPQYERGHASASSSLETSVSTGTVPAGGCLPPEAAGSLMDAGVRYAVVNSECTGSGDGTAVPSSYRTKTGLVVLVPDEAVSRAARAGDTSSTAALAFARLLDMKSVGPLVLSAELGAGGSEVTDLTRSMNALLEHRWALVSPAREVAARPRRSLSLRPGQGADGDPAGYWDDVREARLWSRALVAALGEADASAATALRDSLIAECSAWAGSDGTWALAERGRSFATKARRLAKDVFGGVALAAEPITLAGTAGDVPVTLKNPTGRTLGLRLELTASDGVRVRGKRTLDVELGPRETTVEVPVELRSSLAGRLRVGLFAGETELDSASVVLRASYLDRIVTVGVVALLLGILLAIIIRRARISEQDESAADTYEAYTEAVDTSESKGLNHAPSGGHTAGSRADRDRGQ